jgi:predicted nucleic acid-binding protein
MSGPQGLVLDTSVIIKWYRQGEVLADQALILRDAYLRGQIPVTVPDLVAYELANVLRFKTDLSAEQVCAGVQSLFDLDLEWVAPSAEAIGRAVEIARAHDTTVYDAVFVALAESLGTTLITADARLAQRLAALPHVRSLGDVPL